MSQGGERSTQDRQASIRAEDEALKTSYLDAVRMESPKAQEYVQQQVSATLKNRVDEEVSKAIDEYFQGQTVGYGRENLES